MQYKIDTTDDFSALSIERQIIAVLLTQYDSNLNIERAIRVMDDHFQGPFDDWDGFVESFALDFYRVAFDTGYFNTEQLSKDLDEEYTGFEVNGKVYIVRTDGPEYRYNKFYFTPLTQTP